MQNRSSQKASKCLCLLLSFLTLGVAGCADGPFYAMKRVNPYFVYEWQKDSEIGPTFDDRLAEIELLESRLSSMSPEEQGKWASQLYRIIKSDPSPQLRFRAVKVIARIASPVSVEALNQASADEVEKVRLAACKAWAVQGGSSAKEMLMSLAVKEGETPSVRQAAVESLANFDDPEVRELLANLLDDPSPAMQYRVASTLKTMTGKNYNGDMASWKAFLAGQDVPEPEQPSFTAGVIDSIPKLW